MLGKALAITKKKKKNYKIIPLKDLDNRRKALWRRNWWLCWANWGRCATENLEQCQ